jgi:leader peptidase (prepilin peptidase)/N-methyltransferase
VELLTALLFAALGWRFGITLDTILLALWVGLLVATLFIDLEHFIIPDELNAAGVVLGVGRDLLKLYLPATGPAWTMADLSIPGGMVVHVPRSILGALCFMAALYLVRLLGSVAFKKEAMGLGDVKLAAAIGANLVLGQILVAAFASVLVGSVVGIFMLATGRLEGEAEEAPAALEFTAQEAREEVADPVGEAAEPLELQQGEGSPTTSCDQEEEWDVPPGALPFGPFLVVGVLIAIFWGNELFATYLRHVGLGP